MRQGRDVTHPRATVPDQSPTVGLVVDCVPAKRADVAFVKPIAHMASRTASGNEYEFSSKSQSAYHAVYRQARFSLTQLKSGWDCMRHYEILAAGSVPYFVEMPPPGQLRMLPLKLLREATELLGVDLRAPPSNSSGKHDIVIDHALFNETAYLELAYRLLDFTKRHLTTAQIARYVLETIGRPNATRVLVLGSSGVEDYVRDHIVHGFKSLVEGRGGVVVDAVRPMHMYENGGSACRDGQEVASRLLRLADNFPVGADLGMIAEHAEHDLDLYGMGFSYAGWLPNSRCDFPGEDSGAGAGGGGERSPPSLRSRVANREFDVVVYGSAHRGLPLLEEVAMAYARDEIVFVDGEDSHGPTCPLTRVLGGMGHVFMREIPHGACRV